MSLASTGNIIVDVRINPAGADAEIQAYRAKHGVTPDLIEAISWTARAALADGDCGRATAYADQVHNYAQRRTVDSEPHLPIALGAAIEVKAQCLAREGQRAEAVSYLRDELKAYSSTSIRTRIQKNLNLLSLEGKPAPALDTAHWLGPKPPPTKGRPVLLFFWAHWCPDCKAEEPLLEKLPKDLIIIAPTQHYGYIQNGTDATPEQETKYIDAVRKKYYPNLPVPISEANFDRYGASTTPTLVFIDRHGIVQLYHPGAMTYRELVKAISK